MQRNRYILPYSLRESKRRRAKRTFCPNDQVTVVDPTSLTPGKFIEVPGGELTLRNCGLNPDVWQVDPMILGPSKGCHMVPLQGVNSPSLRDFHWLIGILLEGAGIWLSWFQISFWTFSHLFWRSFESPTCRLISTVGVCGPCYTQLFSTAHVDRVIGAHLTISNMIWVGLPSSSCRHVQLSFFWFKAL